MRRRSKLTGSAFAQTLVFGWLADPQASLSSLTQMAATVGVQVSPQALFQRFGREAAECMERVLRASVEQMIAAEPVDIPILRRFSAVAVMDSSTITLPNCLEDVWKGCGGTGPLGKSALKLQVRMDLNTGALSGPFLEDGRSADGNSPLQREPLPAGALRIADLGYFKLDTFRELDEQGSYFLSRLKVGTKLYRLDGTELDVSALLRSESGGRIDSPALVASRHRLPVRLLSEKVSRKVSDERRRLKAEAAKKGRTISKDRLERCDWTILITNACPQTLDLEEALALARARWQIELLFKLWKERGGIDKWRSENPWRILCEVYAKLIAKLILHWTLLAGCWEYPHRSLVKAARTVRSYAVMLAYSMTGKMATSEVVRQIGSCLSSGCSIDRRRKRPNTCHLLLALDERP